MFTRKNQHTLWRNWTWNNQIIEELPLPQTGPCSPKSFPLWGEDKGGLTGIPSHSSGFHIRTRPWGPQIWPINLSVTQLFFPLSCWDFVALLVKWLKYPAFSHQHRYVPALTFQKLREDIKERSMDWKKGIFFFLFLISARGYWLLKRKKLKILLVSDLTCGWGGGHTKNNFLESWSDCLFSKKWR